MFIINHLIHFSSFDFKQNVNKSKMNNKVLLSLLLTFSERVQITITNNHLLYFSSLINNFIWNHTNINFVFFKIFLTDL